MNSNIIFSIIIPTFNSEKTLPITLESIRQQKFDQNKIEILVCDGGSIDKTLEIAKNYNCQIIKNEKKLPEWGKFVGLLESKGKYIIFMDSDEEFINKNSLQNRLTFFENNKEVKNIICSGLINPIDRNKINLYLNSMGDPFSFFIYNITGDDYENSLSTKYSVVKKEKNFFIIKFKEKELLPIIDGGTHTFEKDFLINLFAFEKITIQHIPQIFCMMAQKTRLLGVMVGDYINHYSTSNLPNYIKKIKWRIENNIFRPKETGVGFGNRNKYLPTYIKIKKYLFLPYSYSILFPLITGIKLAIKKKNIVFLLHPILCFYTATYILFCFIIKIIGIKLKQKAYGEK